MGAISRKSGILKCDPSERREIEKFEMIESRHAFLM